MIPAPASMSPECEEFILSDKVFFLKSRAEMLDASRSFFKKREVLEVDCPALSRAAPIDLHIDIIEAEIGGCEKAYLHSSPEYGMKRLLSMGAGDIYQMSHVFRKGEIGRLHNPEFTMVEWYRLHHTFEQLIYETLEYIHLFLGHFPKKFYTYRQVLLEFAEVDYLLAETQDLISLIEKKNLQCSKSLKDADKDTLLQFLMSVFVEPNLNPETAYVITDFPASQAALAKTVLKNNELVARRFEIYFNGIELANGYEELTSFEVQRERLKRSQMQRIKMGKDPLVIDEQFLEALKMGLPPCCGVAVGFDRLLMLKHKKKHLSEVLPFAWADA